MDFRHARCPAPLNHHARGLRPGRQHPLAARGRHPPTAVCARKDTTITNTTLTYTIKRLPDGRTAVNGRLNELATSLLRGREFTELESNGLGMEMRLPAHFDEARQIVAAVDAANDLRTFGFGVELDPRLGTLARTFVETRSPDPGHDLALLTHRLAVADRDHEAVARHTGAVFGSDGALARLAAFTEVLSGWAARLGHVPGDDLSDILAEHARALDDMHRALADTEVRIKALGSLYEDDRAPNLRRHAATATTQTRSAVPTPAEPPAPLESGQPGPRRAR
ncbi:hypothetical protein ABTX81_01975 [Kitasatospora sp. NPDC097605]|uniref:hypothetical protein n=1 Tax=Kitasatospora sp. NPDC097605 TaxID=3157226 RepID=UPI003326D550